MRDGNEDAERFATADAMLEGTYRVIVMPSLGLSAMCPVSLVRYLS